MPELLHFRIGHPGRPALPEEVTQNARHPKYLVPVFLIQAHKYVGIKIRAANFLLPVAPLPYLPVGGAVALVFTGLQGLINPLFPLGFGAYNIPVHSIISFIHDRFNAIKIL
jgi:hypothetical protein